MPRPKTSEFETSIEERIEQAFWELIRDNPPERISVVALAQQAHCNRGTFYYYFTDIYDLLDRLVEKNIPSAVTVSMMACVAGKTDRDGVIASLKAEEDRLKRLGFLLMRSTSNYCALRLKDSLIDVWCSTLGIDRGTMDKRDYLLFEFAASGILGMMAYMSKNYKEYRVEDMATVLMPEIPQALLCCVAHEREVPSC